MELMGCDLTVDGSYQYIPRFPLTREDGLFHSDFRVEVGTGIRL